MFLIKLRPVLSGVHQITKNALLLKNDTSGLLRQFSNLTIPPIASLKFPKLEQKPAAINFVFKIPNVHNFIQSRSVTKFSLGSGKRKSVRGAIKRFKRLDWGIWIRTRTGRHKKLWKKSPELRKRLRQHVFCNATQSHMLDKMVTKFWRKPKNYVDDPYTPYHKRENFFSTKRKPTVW